MKPEASRGAGGASRSPKHRKKDRRVERTRRLLHEALIDLVRERNYDEITVQDILDRADVGRSTFYTHFRNKDHLLLGDLGTGLTEEALVIGEVDLFQHLEDNYDLYRALVGTEGLPAVQSRLRRSLFDSWEERFSKANESGAENEIPTQVATHFLAGAQMEVIAWWLQAGMPYSPEQMNGMLKRLVAGCLAGASPSSSGGS